MQLFHFPGKREIVLQFPGIPGKTRNAKSLSVCDVAVVPGVDDVVHSEYLHIRPSTRTPWSSGHTLNCCKIQMECIVDKFQGTFDYFRDLAFIWFQFWLHSPHNSQDTGLQAVAGLEDIEGFFDVCGTHRGY